MEVEILNRAGDGGSRLEVQVEHEIFKPLTETCKSPPFRLVRLSVCL